MEYLNKILLGDCRENLRRLPSGIAHCCVTSPPYWGLRDYSTAQWEGGSAGCDHINYTSTQRGTSEGHSPDQDGRIGGAKPYKTNCGRCGAKRVDRQIGLEKTPEQYVAEMVAIFAEVRRILLPGGTLWCNLGDSYAGSGKGQGPNRSEEHTSELQSQR